MPRSRKKTLKWEDYFDIMDYTIFYKRKYKPSDAFDCPEYDLFISAYDECDRTRIPYEKIKAREKVWLIFPQYVLKSEPPQVGVYYNEGYRESDYFSDFKKKYDKDSLREKNICLDSTGFLRSHLVYLIAYFNFIGVKKLDILYTEPNMYSRADETNFSANIDSVRTIDGCSSSPVLAEEMNDVLIVCSGYDEKGFFSISSNKSNCKYKYHIIGFPSLQPDMYQECMLRYYNVKESVGNSERVFAPAFDPFVTAQVIEEIINKISSAKNITNIYLSPLSTKPQTIGMALYYLYSKSTKPVNILFPFSLKYSSGHTNGVKRTWRYTIELPGLL